jgi:hypothetical protein
MLRNKDLQEELSKCKPYLEQNWEKQNNKDDSNTGFIYFCQKLEQVLDLSKTNEVNEVYAVHRWYNFMTSKEIERIFCDLGATSEKDIRNHEIDLYIKGISFDIKLSIVSNKFEIKDPLTGRKGKENYLKWLIENQSNENRKHSENKIYVIIDSDTYINKLMNKSNFIPIKLMCAAFMEYYLKKDFNKIKLENGKEIFADLIYIKL